jgi:uncharacterized protein
MVMEKRAILGEIHPAAQAIFTLGVALFFTIVVLMAGIALATPFSDVGIMKMINGLDPSDPQNINMMKYFQIISHLGMFIIPSFVLAWLFGKKVANYLFLKNIPESRILLLSAVLIFVAVPFINFILELNMQMHLPERFRGIEEWMRRSEESAEQLTKTFLRVNTIEALLFNLFMIAVIPAIGEELMFRGVLMRIFHRWTASGHLAIWITAIIFSAIHMQFFGFFPRLILGVLFGYLVLYTGSIWPAIIAHFVNNATAVIAWYLFHQQITDGVFDDIGKGSEGLLYASVSLVLTVALILWIRTKSKETNPHAEEPENQL